jgi:selenocysteine lyase/cysteine desulfurase
MHFTGTLHNLEGLRRAGLAVRVVRVTDWDVPLEAMEDANIVSTLTGNRIRVSPAVFNNEEDIDLISEVLNRV